MSKGGLFAHFKSKEEVRIGVLEHTVKVGERQIIALAMRSAEGLPRLKAFMKHWLGWTKRAGLPGGCPVAAAMFELDDIDRPLQDWVLTEEKRWCDFLRHSGQLKPNLDTEQFVWEMCGIYLSYQVSYRFRKARDADQRAQTAFDALLARALPPRRRLQVEKPKVADRTH